MKPAHPMHSIDLSPQMIQVHSLIRVWKCGSSAQPPHELWRIVHGLTRVETAVWTEDAYGIPNIMHSSASDGVDTLSEITQPAKPDGSVRHSLLHDAHFFMGRALNKKCAFYNNYRTKHVYTDFMLYKLKKSNIANRYGRDSAADSLD
jgi:hypothetical protein